MSGPNTGSFNFQRSRIACHASTARNVADTENRSADSQDQEIPFATDEIAEIDEELRRRREFRAEILEDFAKDRHDPHNQEGGDRKRDADDDDRIGHRRFDFLAQSRAGFEEPGQPIQNLREQTAGFTRFHHADKQPVENARMFRDRFMESFAALNARGHVADDVAQDFCRLGIALLVERGQRLDERNAGVDHRGQLPGEKHQIGLFDRPNSFARSAARSLLLQRKHHEAATHEAGHGVVFIESILNAGDNPAGGITSLVGECDHTSNYKPYSSYDASPKPAIRSLLRGFSLAKILPMHAASDLTRISPSLLLWQAYDPAVKADLFSTALVTANGIYLIDPIPLDRDPLNELIHLGPIRGIIVTNANLWRAAPEFGAKFSVPIVAKTESLPAKSDVDFHEIGDGAKIDQALSDCDRRSRSR